MKTASGTLLFLLLFTRVSSQITEIQRDSRIYAFNVNSNLSFVGHEFRNHQISNFSTKFMATQCAMECHRTARCQSFNFASKTRQCLLNDATHEDFPEDLANDSSTTGTVYYLKEAISINPVKYLDSVFLLIMKCAIRLKLIEDNFWYFITKIYSDNGIIKGKKIIHLL